MGYFTIDKLSFSDEFFKSKEYVHTVLLVLGSRDNSKNQYSPCFLLPHHIAISEDWINERTNLSKTKIRFAFKSLKQLHLIKEHSSRSRKFRIFELCFVTGNITFDTTLTSELDTQNTSSSNKIRSKVVVSKVVERKVEDGFKEFNKYGFKEFKVEPITYRPQGQSVGLDPSTPRSNIVPQSGPILLSSPKKIDHKKNDYWKSVAEGRYNAEL